MSNQEALRSLPAISTLLHSEGAGLLLAQYPRRAVVQALREAVEEARQRLLQGLAPPPDPVAQVVANAATRLKAQARSGLRPVINATGIIVHTNLGRSVLSEAAARAVYEAATSYTNLEADLHSGRRSSRHVHIEPRLRRVLGAPAGAVFNNNAAAVMLALATIARGREVIVSRGQLVEIGGSFRIPEVIAHSGCVLREVGATNRTHLRDYEQAIGENTAAILRAHQSNYRIVGFTHEPTVEELAALAHAHGLPLVDDLGSGAVVDLAAVGAGQEPTVSRSLEAGADLVMFSGDKLIGGPQCGIVVGRPDLVEAMKKHPFARAVRVDKMTLAALAATLDILADPVRALQEIPTLRMATEPQESVHRRAIELAGAISAGAHGRAQVAVCLTDSARVGGGSLPQQALPTAVVQIRPSVAGLGPNELAYRLRTGDPAVYPWVQEGAVILDARTIFPSQVQDAARAVVAALSGDARGSLEDDPTGEAS